jgi:dihydrofolate reductase
LSHFYPVWTPAEGERGRPVAAPFPDIAVSASSSDLTIRTSADGEKGSHAQTTADEPPALKEPGTKAHTEGDQKMRKLIVSTYATLDGRVDELQNWVVPWNDDAVAKYHTDLLNNSDGLLLGRKTYEIFAAMWPSRSGELPYADKLNSMAKYVASTTLGDLEWENSHLIEGDVADGVTELKQQPGQDLVMYGSYDLMHSLLEHDLIDEYQILVHPILLGRGRSFFKGSTKQVSLELVDTVVIASGVAVLVYQPVR